jgi:hypothetical protein
MHDSKGATVDKAVRIIPALHFGLWQRNSSSPRFYELTAVTNKLFWLFFFVTCCMKSTVISLFLMSALEQENNTYDLTTNIAHVFCSTSSQTLRK